jgi:aminopeptidase N
MRSIAQAAQGLRRTNRATAPRFTAMVSNRYSDPDRVFSKMDNPYSKGALVLHMLRMRMGDEAFFKGVRLYIDRFKFREVETDDFRLVMEEVSGLSLEQFFESYAMRPGIPKLAVDLAWDASAGVLTISAEQTQPINRFNPAYALTLPIVVELEGGGTATTTLSFAERTGRVTVPLTARPIDVRIDPEITCLAAVTKRTPLEAAPAQPATGGDEPSAP